MKEEILYILQLLNQDFFIAFGLFTILYLLLSIFIKKPILHQFDENATQFISFIGILYLIVYSIGLTIELNVLNEIDRASLLHRMFGKYAIGFWTQPLLWVLMTQLLRFEKIRSMIFLRLLFSLFFIFTIERMVLLSVVFHRDYLPMSWTMSYELPIYPPNFFLMVLMKIMVFLLFAGLFQFIKSKIQRFKLQRKGN